MRCRRRCSGDVYAELRYPPGASIEAAMEEAARWGEQFPGAHLRLEIGDTAVITVRVPRRRRGRKRVKES
jgi:hypothetical protein